jgi:hypothetical protein
MICGKSALTGMTETDMRKTISSAFVASVLGSLLMASLLVGATTSMIA